MNVIFFIVAAVVGAALFALGLVLGFVAAIIQWEPRDDTDDCWETGV